MKKRIISAILILPFVLSACAGGTDQADEPSTEQSQSAASVAVQTTEAASEATDSASTDTTDEADSDVDLANGSPWINSCLKENVTADTVTDLKDDYTLYVNKDWILENEIPDGYSGWDHYSERAADVRDQCLELLKDDSLTGHNAELAQGLFNAYLDWDSRNALGVEPIRDISSKILALKTIDQVNEYTLSEEGFENLSSIIGFYIYNNINDSNIIIPYIAAPSLLLDSAEYTERTEYGDYIYNYYHDIFVYLAGRLDITEDEANNIFDSAIAYESILAEGVASSEEQMSAEFVEASNNPITYEDLCALASNYPLKEMMDISGITYDGEYNITEPDALAVLDSSYTNENIDGIRSYLYVHYLLSNVAYLDEETRDYASNAYNNYFGVSGTTSDDIKAYTAVRNNIPSAMEQIYLDKYCSEEDKQKVEDVCHEVIDTYKEMLNENEWMSDETKTYALKKLDTMAVHAAYPDKYNDLSDLDISGLSYYEATNKISLYNYKKDIAKIGTSPDKEMWADDMFLLDCNAFYNPSDNSINLIVGMMGEPFYSSDMPIEELYASLGAFWVGHEVSHAFDSNGCQYDADGNLNNWWTEADKEEFDKRIAKLDSYLDSILVFGDYYVTGSNVDTEMLADISGVQVALKMASKVDNFDYDLFFTKYAQMNTSIDLYSTDLMMLQQDPHPINYLRSNVPIQQFDEFYETYDIKEGDNMYLAPEDRLLVW